MTQKTDMNLGGVEAAVAAWSAKLDRLASRLAETSAESRRDVEREIAELRAARDDITTRLGQLETSRLSGDERAAEGLRLLVEDVGKKIEACGQRLGVKD